MSVKVIQGLSVTDSERVGGNGTCIWKSGTCAHEAVAMLHISEKSTCQSIDNQRSAMFDCRKYNFFVIFLLILISSDFFSQGHYDKMMSRRFY